MERCDNLSLARSALVRLRAMDGGKCSASLERPIWLLPNARDEPPSDPRGVIRIARKLCLKDSVLRDGAMEQKRQAEDHNERGREPRSERGSACRQDHNPGGISGMADEGVGSRGDDVLAAVALDAND